MHPFCFSCMRNTLKLNVYKTRERTPQRTNTKEPPWQRQIRKYVPPPRTSFICAKLNVCTMNTLHILFPYALLSGGRPNTNPVVLALVCSRASVPQYICCGLSRAAAYCCTVGSVYLSMMMRTLSHFKLACAKKTKTKQCTNHRCV